jgi:NitT/TauT family transport system substrate-binding protein
VSTGSRRRFLLNASALAAAQLTNLPAALGADNPPEVNRVRLIQSQAMCLAPQYLAGDLLRAEGFEQVHYLSIVDVVGTQSIPEMLADGRADFSMDGAPTFLPQLDVGRPVVVLCGIHAGCYELYAHQSIRAIRDLRGKRVAVSRFQIERYFISSMMAYVGIDPRRNVDWVTVPSFSTSMRLYLEHKVDAFLAFPPQPQELREANPEDTLRFHALRLHEVGMIQSAPNKLIAQSTDWRFLNELKLELKG